MSVVAKDRCTLASLSLYNYGAHIALAMSAIADETYIIVCSMKPHMSMTRRRCAGCARRRKSGKKRDKLEYKKRTHEKKHSQANAEHNSDSDHDLEKRKGNRGDFLPVIPKAARTARFDLDGDEREDPTNQVSSLTLRPDHATQRVCVSVASVVASAFS